MTPFTGNHLLAALPAGDQALLAADMQEVFLTRGQILFEDGQVPAHVYFPYAGSMVSLVLPLRDGGVTETVSIGVEGAVGLTVDPSDRAVPSFGRGLVQLPGQAARISRERLADAALASPSLARVLARFMEALMSMAVQSVACNANHPVRSRLARWLLIASDRANPGGDPVSLPLTQEFLAEMLGVRRATVGETLLAFQAEGTLRVRRGRILIGQRDLLEKTSCECYGTIRRRFADLLPAPSASGTPSGRRMPPDDTQA